jgi:CRP/FNR family cyclic AMP-dependent transcriptional regulator
MKFIELFRGWEDVVDHSAGTVIFSEQDPADVMYFILAGDVELSFRGVTLGAERKGGFIGEMAMIDSATCSVTATAMDEVKLARLDRDQLKTFIDRNTEFALHVMAVMADRLRTVDEYISTQFAQSE